MKIKTAGKNSILLDMDIFSYIFRKTKEQPALAELIRGKNTSIAFVTLGEIYFGAFKANWGATKTNDLKRELSRHTVIYPDYATCLLYGDIKSECLSKGCLIGDPDYWIAASAVSMNIPLLTNNRKHFERINNLEIVTF